MDDVDAVQAQIARNMLQSGDWVTARLDGVAYLEKSPLDYWMMAVLVQDLRGARLGGADSDRAVDGAAVLACHSGFGIWAFGTRAGLYAGWCMATCIGLFLFTRILIPDVILTLTITLAMWAIAAGAGRGGAASATCGRSLMWAAMGTGLLLKGLIAAVFPVAAGLSICSLTRQLFRAKTWKRLRPFSGHRGASG